MGKKILVAYYSKTGTTERVAKDIAAKLNADVEKIIDQKSRSGILGWLIGGKDASKKLTTEIGAPAKDPGNYDVTIIGTPIWAWNMTPAVRTYIEQNKSKLKNMAFFTTAGSTKPDKVVVYMEELSGKSAVAYTGFSTRELKDAHIYSQKLSAFVKKIMDIG